MTTAKETYKRLLFAEQMKKKVAALEKKMALLQNKMDELTQSCPHYHSSFQNKGSSGGWDNDEHYWRNYSCDDCGRHWTTDQSYEQDKKFPYSIDRTYER